MMISLPFEYFPFPRTKNFQRTQFKELMNLFITAAGPEQHGGTIGASTTTASIAIQDHVTNLLDRDNVSGVQIIAYDMSKAFDKLDYEIIIKRLIECSFPKEFVDLMRSYLSCRKQSVRLRSHVSPPVSLGSGVPQGSVLGPLLYNAASGGLKTIHSTSTLVKYIEDITLVLPIFKKNTNKHILEEHNNL